MMQVHFGWRLPWAASGMRLRQCTEGDVLVTLARGDLREAADAALLAMARAGDSEAFGIVYERHVAAARQLSYQLAAAPRVADDIVADAFGRMLDVVTRGGGPQTAVRPYVLTAVRRVYYDRLPGTRGQPAAEATVLPDPDQLLVDPEFAGLETALIARAYQSLPERSRAVLWHTEIEQDAPADVAPLLGMTRNGVAALRRRAADDLRHAYLQMHISLITQPGCRPVAERLGAYDRRSLSARDAALVSEHLARCEGCQVVHRELTDIMASVRGVVAPLVLGPAAAGYLADAGLRNSGSGDPAAAPGSMPPGRDTAPLLAPETALVPTAPGLRHAARAHRRSLVRSPRRTRRSRRVAAAAAAGAVLAVTAGIALAVTLTGNGNTPASARQLAPPPSLHATATQPPSPSPQPSPSPSSQPAAPVPAPIQLTASLILGGGNPSKRVTFQVANAGSTASGPLTAVISLPAGTWLSSGDQSPPPGGDQGSAEGTALPFSGGWSCQPVSGGATCTHAALSAGQQAQGVLFITVTGSGACGQSVRLTVTSGGTTVGASGAIGC
jgi:DNA-directed RNA polymerase specialized sigma24 family protein